MKTGRCPRRRDRPARRRSWPALVTLVPLLASLLLSAGAGCSGPRKTEPRSPSPAFAAELERWLQKNGAAPKTFVLGLFRDHDVVFLGEQHRIRHDPLLVASLLQPLYDAGVRVLATEFGRRCDQALIDSVVTGTDWDEAGARRIIFRQFMPWGFREYVDIFKAAWRLNRDRPPGAPPLRVLGLNNRLDVSFFRSEADWDDPAVWQKVLGDQTEKDWAEVILAQVRAGRKVLVHCGIHHAFTEFRQPKVKDGKYVGDGIRRCGNFVYQALGKRAVTVYLHAPWNDASGYAGPTVHPAEGVIDAFMLERQGGPFPVGFEIPGSPLARLELRHAVYRHGREPLLLSQFCDGWIYTKPLSEYEMVTYIPDWITEENLAAARRGALNPRLRDYTVEQLNAACGSDADFIRFFGHLR